MGHSSLASVVALLLLVGGCTSGEPGLRPTGADAASHDTGLVQIADAATTPFDALQPDGATSAGGGDAEVTPEAGPPVVPPPAVGLNPASDPEQPAATELELADLEVLAVGSRALSLRSDQVVDRSGALTARARSLSEGSVQFLVSVPLELHDQDEAWMSSWTEIIDQLFEQPFALSYLVIGQSLDLKLASLSKAGRKQALELVAAAAGYVRQHPLRPPQVRLGVSASLRGWADPDASMEQLAKLADVVSGRWFVTDDDEHALTPGAALEELQTAIEAARQLGRPLVLEQVSYPHSEAWGSSPQAQAEFYERLFEYLGTRQEQLRFVAVTALDELTQEVCAEYSLQYVRTNMLPCDVGLRDRQGRERPAFEAVIEALARFSSSRPPNR